MRISEFKKKIIELRGKELWENIKDLLEYKIYMAPEEKQLKVVKNTGYAIKYINNPTKKMQYYAIKKEPFAIEYVDNPSEEMQLLAVKKSPIVIQYIKNPTEKVIEEAIKQVINQKIPTCQYIDFLKYLENDLKEDKKEETNDTI